MDFHVFCNLLPVLQLISAQLGELLSDESDNMRYKTVRFSELSPMVKFELGPFESEDDNVYKDNRYVNTVNLISKKIHDGMSGIEERRPFEKKTEKKSNGEIFKWRNYKENKMLLKEKNWPYDHIKQLQETSSSESESSDTSNTSQQITAIRTQMQIFKTLSPLLVNLKSEIHKMESALIIKPFENLLNVLEKSFTDGENRNTLRRINNKTCNNQYQIGNVFAIHQLSKLEEIINESFERKTSNSGADPTGVDTKLQQGDTDLLNQLQKNFSRMFSHQNVSPQQLNQMSKIIDFVEKFHGAVAVSKDSKVTSNVGVKGRKSMEKVFTDEEFDFFDTEEERESERGRQRRKGSVGSEEGEWDELNKDF